MYTYVNYARIISGALKFCVHHPVRCTRLTLHISDSTEPRPNASIHSPSRLARASWFNPPPESDGNVSVFSPTSLASPEAAKPSPHASPPHPFHRSCEPPCTRNSSARASPRVPPTPFLPPASLRTHLLTPSPYFPLLEKRGREREEPVQHSTAQHSTALVRNR